MRRRCTCWFAVTLSPRRGGHHEDRRRLVTAVPVGVDDSCSRLVARLSGKREIEGQALRHLARSHSAREQQDEPTDDDDAPVAEHERCQAAESGARLAGGRADLRVGGVGVGRSSLWDSVPYVLNRIVRGWNSSSTTGSDGKLIGDD